MGNSSMLFVVALINIVFAQVEGGEDVLARGAVCYQFCEDNGCEFIDRKSDCAQGLMCARPNDVGFNSKWVCSPDNQSHQQAAVFPSSITPVVKTIGTVAAMVCVAFLLSFLSTKSSKDMQSENVLEALQKKQRKGQSTLANSVEDEKKKFFQEARRKRAAKVEEEANKKAVAEKKKVERRENAKAEAERQERERRENAKAEAERQERERERRAEEHKQLIGEKKGQRKAAAARQEQGVQQDDHSQRQAAVRVGGGDEAAEATPTLTVATVYFQLPDGSKFSLQLPLSTTVAALQEQLSKLTRSPAGMCNVYCGQRCVVKVKWL